MLVISCALGLTACATSPNSANSVSGFRLDIEDAAPITEAEVEVADANFVPVVDAASPSPSPAATLAQDDVDTDVEVLSVLVGQRWLYAGEADDIGVDRPFFFGVEFDGYDSETGHGYEVGYGWSDEDDSAGTGLSFQEIYAGYRFTMNADDWLQPYFGLGLTYLHANIDGAGAGDDDDDAYGGYARVGLATSFDRLRFALDYRHTWANLHIAGQDVDGDYDQLALTAGWQF
jgi:hypothetical protein